MCAELGNEKIIKEIETLLQNLREKREVFKENADNLKRDDDRASKDILNCIDFLLQIKPKGLIWLPFNILENTKGMLARFSRISSMEVRQLLEYLPTNYDIPTRMREQIDKDIGEMLTILPVIAYSEFVSLKYSDIPDTVKQIQETEKSLTTRFDNFLDEIKNKVETDINGLKNTSLDVFTKQNDKMLGITEKASQNSEQVKKDLKELLEKTKKESEEILEIARATAADSATQNQAERFEEEAKENLSYARRWLIATVAVALLTPLIIGTLMWVGYDSVAAPDNGYEFALKTTSKAFIFAVLMFLLVFCARNHQANRHNVVINRHRCNSLATYRALVAAAGDQANKNIVLTKAADSIFDPQPSGFAKLGNSQDSGGNSNISIQVPAKFSD